MPIHDIYDMPLDDLMTQWPQTIQVFIKYNTLCVGCLVSPFHTIADTCAEYDLSEDFFMNEIIAVVKNTSA